jgi:glutaconyl-CoA decarboxylase
MNKYTFSMPSYFQNMPNLGAPILNVKKENLEEIKKSEDEMSDLKKKILESGTSTESLNKRGQWTAIQRIYYLVDEGSWCPLNSMFNPEDNKHGSTAVINGLGKINGKWAVIIASDNKKLAGAWIAGQAENIVRAQDTAKRLNIPLVWLLNCSGVKLDEQEKVYANRVGGGTPFYKHAELQQAGIPVLVGIYGTNPAGGGYHSISPTILIAHKDANMAVGGAGIVGGMNPKGFMDREGADDLIASSKQGTAAAPGRVEIHHGQTGFFREVAETDEEVVDRIKNYMDMLPAYDNHFFRVDEPREPLFESKDLYSIIPTNSKRTYKIKDVLSRIFDGSEAMEYKPDYGPEIYTGIAKMNGMLVGVVANTQGILMNYPEYKENSVGIGGKLYRQGLIKMSEFVTFCSRDRLPIVWIQDTSGIDVGDEAEKAELLGLGQSLIYSVQKSDLPQMEITLRKGSAAAHYVLGGPQGATNAFSLGTATTEMYVMNGETAAAAMFSRKLVKSEGDDAKIESIIDDMNKMIDDYKEKSTPTYCAKQGFVDEIVKMTDLRKYIGAFVEASYQNPKSICAFHQMITPRIIRDSQNK